MMGFFTDAFDGLFRSNERPYEDAQGMYRRYADAATNVQKPYQKFGQEGMAGYGDWINSQKDPSQFINNIMGQYQESPYAKYQTQQGSRAAQNQASASGLGGSTPLMHELSDRAQKTASADQQSWLNNVLGINTQYGQGMKDRVNIGQNSANQMSNLYNRQANDEADLAFGRSKGMMQDYDDFYSMLATMFMGGGMK